MKRVISASLFSAIVLSACGPTQKDAIKYNYAVVDIIEGLSKKQSLFMDQTDAHNIDSSKISRIFS